MPTKSTKSQFSGGGSRSAVSGRDRCVRAVCVVFCEVEMTSATRISYIWLCCVQPCCRPIFRCPAGCSRLSSAQLLMVDSSFLLSCHSNSFFAARFQYSFSRFWARIFSRLVFGLDWLKNCRLSGSTPPASPTLSSVACCCCATCAGRCPR